MQKSKELRFADLTAPEEMTLEGWPIVFEKPTYITLPDGGRYVEIIHRGALDHCDLHDSTLKINHDDRMVPLARTGRTMQLTVTDDGLHMVASLAGDNQTAREAYSAIRRGDLSGMSFAFTVADGGSHFDPLTNTRHVTDIERVLEVSIVEHPAYPQASVEARDAITAARDAIRAKAQARAMRISALTRAQSIINHDTD